MLRNVLFGTLTLAASLAFVPSAPAQSGGAVYELRTYTAVEGKLDAVVARFRDHTIKLFEKHGMENVGYWTPADAPKSGNTLVYLLKHKSREAAKASWDAFRKDPAWIKARTESEVNGKIVEKTESIYLTPAGFSRMK